MLKERKKEQWWVEPFVGGGNIIDKVSGKRIGSDSNFYIISAIISIRDYIDYLPKNNKEFTEDDYKRLKYENYKYKGYAGFAFSYGGKWLGGWCRDSKNKRDYVEEAYKNAIQQNKKIQGVIFKNNNYLELEIPQNSIIYCDPPYKGTTKYKDEFNHDIFWQWCKNKTKEGHRVFISEYNAPDDFECIWEKEIVSSLTKNTGSKKGIEKLFISKD